MAQEVLLTLIRRTGQISTQVQAQLSGRRPIGLSAENSDARVCSLTPAFGTPVAAAGAALSREELHENEARNAPPLEQRAPVGPSSAHLDKLQSRKKTLPLTLQIAAKRTTVSVFRLQNQVHDLLSRGLEAAETVPDESFCRG